MASEGDDIAAAARMGIGGTEDGTARAVSRGGPTHPGETHAGGLSSRLNWLRAGVLGANDGIVSVAGLVVGVAGATSERGPIFIAGIAGLTRGGVDGAGGVRVGE